MGDFSKTVDRCATARTHFKKRAKTALTRIDMRPCQMLAGATGACIPCFLKERAA
ncbi:hypothetical protein [Azospirillum oryzae]|uniref:hypothetical protein n=1 Tax=Azospirillum oryzae TaxID=286727 RepID=UPI00142E5A71|nr:hypothetical protein [Azospirillum oryzae]